ncbi:hypothetical protein NL676_011837 [Syzygium grande]|nr:hypothetical protein NL676_011837 [Syzygium grande]
MGEKFASLNARLVLIRNRQRFDCSKQPYSLDHQRLVSFDLVSDLSWEAPRAHLDTHTYTERERDPKGKLSDGDYIRSHDTTTGEQRLRSWMEIEVLRMKKKQK